MKNKINVIGRTGAAVIIGLSQFAFSKESPQTPLTNPTVRTCGLTENMSANGLMEFSQIANMEMVLDKSTGRYEFRNKGKPGTKGYVSDSNNNGEIDSADNQVEGYEEDCERNGSAGTTTRWYKPKN